ncbi:hypothetical protein LTR04_001531 [Oleoguttula sp. CCFEE 6159]|nr:hypothetical protein LTR04_001531 [Oleoguttula sp. CCFEE 6159]
MPPIRTIAAAKPVKTERTHEENQERAYIAASRRSDRSLEARVESARRASEIHKRRTGRSLRVTEQDVVNEEMYEEEDDDLPMQYRRLTAHLQTGSADFNRRLAAYLTSNVAMRSALDQAVNASYALQPYPNAAQFVNQGQYQQQIQHPYPTPMLPPQMANRSPQNYRQSPYPMPMQGYPAPVQQRSASNPTPQDMPSYPGTQSAGPSPVEPPKAQTTSPQTSPTQALSQPSTTPQATPTISRSPSSQNLFKQEPAPQAFVQQDSTFPSHSGKHDSTPSQPTPMPRQFQQARQSPFPNSLKMPAAFDQSATYPSYGPFSMSLPYESQQFLGHSFGGPMDGSDRFQAALMQGSERVQPQRFSYSYNPNGNSSKSRSSNPSFDGINQTLTLAPGMLDTSAGQDFGFSNPSSSTTDGVITPFTPSYGYNVDGSFNDVFKAPDMTRTNSVQNSGGNTPNAASEWLNFVDDNLFEQSTAT